MRSRSRMGRSRVGSWRAMLLPQHQPRDSYDEQKRKNLPQNICFFLAEPHCGLLTINAHFIYLVN
jgi:hypothetical protein